MKTRFATLVEATSTPLASIFGSGFLVIVPILAGAVGRHSVWTMAGVSALAYAVGSVIRFNIRHAEPVLAAQPSEATLSFERASDLALVLAYVISVSCSGGCGQHAANSRVLRRRTCDIGPARNRRLTAQSRSIGTLFERSRCSRRTRLPVSFGGSPAARESFRSPR